MRKFNDSFRGYNRTEVNKFVEEVIQQVESMIQEIEKKDEEINRLYERIKTYEERETNLNRALVMAENTSEQIKRMARDESDMIIDEARRNANRIVNESLMRAERMEIETNILRKNVALFKKRLRHIIESQLELVDDIEKVDF